MPSWLTGLLNLFGGGLSAIWNAFVNVIRSVDGYLEQRINQVQGFANNLYAGLFRLSAYITNFINRTYIPREQWIDGEFRLTSLAIITEIQNRKNADTDIRNWTNSQVSGARSFASSLFSGFVKWIISTIFGPLSKDVASVLDWILHEGAMLLDLITHPEKLLKLLWAFLFGSWLAFLLRYGPVVAAYLLRMWKPILPVVVQTLEDILTHVL